MLASLLRPKRKAARRNFGGESSPTTDDDSTPSPIAARRIRHHDPQAQSRRRAKTDIEDGQPYRPDDGDSDDDEGAEDTAPLLPIFSASHLDSLPVYNLTHDLRLLVASRCETTLTWEQLRSPQVSQFLLKPILQVIHNAHLSRATLYALMANCLQFHKEAGIKPAISGASHTRAMVCELLAIKLLKEYTTRELIDALSYDFHPLQGQTPPSTGSTLHGAGWYSSNRSQQLFKGVRISCLEIAIRAQAKRFLAHPLVVQQLEAIWAGTIVFHSVADHLHREPVRRLQTRNHYGSFARGSDTRAKSGKPVVRRSVSLYDPRDASLFKLSRLRVPRYRQFLSTCSFAVLLGLFLTVIQQRSFGLSPLELVFWFWSAGFMLDELVGFNEQGFGLYLMSFWNTFDVGILFMLFCYYCLRLYSVIFLDSEVAILAYDVLAASAVLLVPRLFSVLDHYRYFSQLLIAFRMMAVDLLAILILIIIACSGFFVAFTFSSGHGDSARNVVYALFQMIMGFTPAAWQLWDKYNPLGKAILTLFLFICHFLVVTILITVLTNSFMAIVQNANEEHQFVFAVNTISMVKSDALFSYVAPTNVLAWLFAPLRFVMPFPKFIKLNRTVIKITHFPILFSIYLYERTILRSAVFEPTDLVAGNHRRNHNSRWLDQNKGFDLFGHGNTFRLREPSIATHQKDEALEEVFRRPVKQSTRRIPRNDGRVQHQSVVNDWIRDIGPDGVAGPPEEEDRHLLEQLEQRRKLRFPGRPRRPYRGSIRDYTVSTRSIASDPEEFRSRVYAHRNAVANRADDGHPLERQITQPTDMEGDDELSSDQQAEDDVSGRYTYPSLVGSRIPEEQDNVSPRGGVNWVAPSSQNRSSRPSTAKLLSGRNSPSARRPQRHTRNLSSATVLYNPLDPWATNDDVEHPKPQRTPLRSPRNKNGTVTSSRSRPLTSSEHELPAHSRPRPIFRSSKAAVEASSVPDLNGLLPSSDPFHLHVPHRRSSLIMGLGSDLGDNKAIGGGGTGGVGDGGLAASFATQMAYATGGLRRMRSNTTEHRDTLNRLVLARMKTLEESFREVVREVKDLRREQSDALASVGVRTGQPTRNVRGEKEGKEEKLSEGEDGDVTELIFGDESDQVKASSI